MAMKCSNCDFEMDTLQSIIRTLGGVLIKLLELLKTIAEIAGHLGKSATESITPPTANAFGVKCPNCGEIGRWVDVE